MQSDLLDVVIGVVFAWFLLSMVLSGIQEAFALLTRTRAKNLWLGIGRLFDPAASPLPRSLRDVAIRLPISGALDLRPTTAPDAQAPAPRSPSKAKQRVLQYATSRPDRRVTDANLIEVRGRNQDLYHAMEPRLNELARPGRLSKITHITASAFSGALIDLARNVDEEDLRASAKAHSWDKERIAELQARLDGLPGDDPLELEDVVGLHADTFASEEELRAVYQYAARSLSGRDVASYMEKNPQLAAAVERAAAAVKASERVAEVRKVVETWFDREMTGLSGFYRRQNRKILLLLGIPLVLLAHANAISLFDDLRRDASLREAAVGAASGASGQSLDSACASTTTAPTSAPAVTTTVDPIVAAGERLKCARNIINRATEFRVGLAVDELKQASEPTDELRPNDVVPYLGNALGDEWGFIGRTVTLVALLFGAQFWFDVLRRLVGIRKTLKGDAAGAGAEHS